MSIEEYCEQNLSHELHIIKNSDRHNHSKQLTIYDKAVIYKYSEDGYESLNEELRKKQGTKLPDLGILLNESLDKLPNYSNLVYCSVFLDSKDLDFYQNTLISGKIITDPTFISTSKSRTIAEQFKGNSLFIILSKTGKSIEEIAKYGTFNPPNEKEVLFRMNTRFSVLELISENGKTVIKLEEV